MCRLLWSFCALLIFASLPQTLLAVPLAITIEAGEVELPGMRLSGVSLRADGPGLRLDANKVALTGNADLQLQQTSLQCPEMGSDASGWCPGGNWQTVAISTTGMWQQPLQGQFTTVIWNGQQQRVESTLLAGAFNAALQYQQSEQGTSAGVKWSGQALANLPFQALLPEQLAWIKQGNSSGELKLDPAGAASGLAVDYAIRLQETSLDSPDGQFAAEGLAVQANGSWSSGKTDRLSVNAKFTQGEVLLDRFYTAFGSQPLQLKTQLEISDQQVDIRNLQLSDDGAMRLHASASFAIADPVNTLKYQVRELRLQFPVAYQRYLEPVLAAWTLDKLTVTGGLDWSGSGPATGMAGDFPTGTLEFNDLSVVDTARNRFAFTGMSAQVQVGQPSGQSSGQSSGKPGGVSQFSWQGMLLGRINLGAGRLGLNTAPGEFALAEPLSLQVLGGEFVIDQFQLSLPPAGDARTEPQVKLTAALNDMDLRQLTEALGWPAFAGKISGRIPGVSWDAGVLTVDGQLGFDVFDGRVELSNLKVERLFGVLPSFAADLDVHNLDLQQLTSVFEFGRIAGRLDGYVHELRMLDWSPVSFDAWMGTPERQSSSNQISRQAVNSLTSIGGGGATAALTGPIMRMFSNFSYRRLGMGCKLENYVCAIRGLADEDNSVLIMEGSGVPKLMIKVFNRRMDFPQLVSNLVAASRGEGIRIGDP
jgi:hypothetical protein